MIDVLLDADVLGRQRTGDETYVRNLLRALPGAAPDLRFAAVTRKPELVPDGVEPIELAAGSQEWRMAWRLPRLVRRLRPRLAHYQHSLPLRAGGRSVLTVHDLSFEREPDLMPRKDRLVFRAVVPRSAKRADRVIAVSERTRDDLEELYGIPAASVKVIPHGIDPIFTPDEAAHDAGYLLVVGSVQRRKDPRAAVDAGNELGMPVVVVGPEREPALARELRALGADVRGYVDHEELPSLYREASALVVPSRYEGFGLPVLEAMASGTPVVAAPDPALVEVAGDAAVFADQGDLSGAILHALDRRAELRAAGLARAAQVQLGRGGPAHRGGLPEPAREHLGSRRRPRACPGARALPLRAEAAGRRSRRRLEPRPGAAGAGGREADPERGARELRREREPRDRRDDAASSSSSATRTRRPTPARWRSSWPSPSSTRAWASPARSSASRTGR